MSNTYSHLENFLKEYRQDVQVIEMWFIFKIQSLKKVWAMKKPQQPPPLLLHLLIQGHQIDFKVP